MQIRLFQADVSQKLALIWFLLSVAKVSGSLLPGDNGHGHEHHHDHHHHHHHDEGQQQRSPKRIDFAHPFNIPRTSFSCKDRAPGYYADVDTDCMVYYLCHGHTGGRPFICPMGTRFHQRTLVCDHATRVNCQESSNFFHQNVVLHKASIQATQEARQWSKDNLLVKRSRSNSPIIHIQAPHWIPSSANGRLTFAPLFKQGQQQKLQLLADSMASSALNNDEGHSHKQQDPENTIQIVGHIMDLGELPNSRITTIPYKNGGQISTTALELPPDPLVSERKGKSDQIVGIPLHLTPPEADQPRHLVWISPASVARSPMVKVRRLQTTESS